MSEVFRSQRRPFAAAIAAFFLLVASAEPQERFRRTPPLAETRQDLKLEPIESSELANGLKLFVARRPRSPLVTLQIVVGAGESDSPADLPGVAAVTARMIGRGTKLLSADQIEDMVESIGAEFSASVLMDYTVFRMDVLEEHLDRALLALKLMILDPVFSERALAAVKRAVYYEQLERKKDHEFLGWRHLRRLLFENHPYRSETYNEDVIRIISSKDVQAFYGRFYIPNNVVFAASGNVDAAAISWKIGEHFGAWARRNIQRPAVPPPAPNSRERVCFIESADSPDAIIFVGNVIMDSNSPDYFPFMVLNQALGGTTQSRLFMNLRESRAYAYYAFSEAEFFRSCGVFWARARVTPHFIQPAVKEIVRELKAFSSDRAPAAEIEEAKAYLIGNLPLKFASLDSVSEWTARIAALGLNSGHWNRVLENIMVVNVEKVQAAGQKYLSATPLVVIVGRREWILDHLQEFKVVEIYDNNGVLKQTLLTGVER